MFRDTVHCDPAVAKLAGKLIVEAVWTDSSLALVFEDESALRLEVDSDGVSLHAGSRIDIEVATIDDEVVDVRLPSENFVWDRARLAKKLVGNRLNRVSGSAASRYIDITPFGILYVTVFRNRQTGEAILMWLASE